jgi:hypothetical protein
VNCPNAGLPIVESRDDQHPQSGDVLLPAAEAPAADQVLEEEGVLFTPLCLGRLIAGTAMTAIRPAGESPA